MSFVRPLSCAKRAFHLHVSLVVCFGSLGCSGTSNSSNSGTGGSSPSAPAIAQISPSSVAAGSAATTITVTGTGFNVASVVNSGSTALSTTYSGPTSLQATLPAALLTNSGNLTLTVVNPASSGGTSSAVNFSVTAPVSTQLILTQPASDLAMDPVRGVVYATVPAGAAANANSIVTIDPATGTLSGVTPAGSNPDAIAISSDGAYLYVASDGDSSVRRYLLPSMTLDFTVTLPSYPSTYTTTYALSLAVAPGSPNVWAVSIGLANRIPTAMGLVIYDGTVPRTSQVSSSSILADTIVWGKNIDTLYGADTEDSARMFYTFPATSAGIGTIATYPNAFSFLNSPALIHFESSTGWIYADDGEILDPGTGKVVGGFSMPGALTTDGLLKRVFVADGAVSGLTYLLAYDLNSQALVNSLQIQVAGAPHRILRWGTSGLIFNTINPATAGPAGRIFIYSGPLVH